MSERAGAFLAARRTEEEAIREWRRAAVAAFESLKNVGAGPPGGGGGGCGAAAGGGGGGGSGSTSGISSIAITQLQESLVAGDLAAWGGPRGYFRPASAAAYLELPLTRTGGGGGGAASFDVRECERFMTKSRHVLQGLRSMLEEWTVGWMARNKEAEAAWEAASKAVVEARAVYEAGLNEKSLAEQDNGTAAAAASSCIKNLKTNVKGYSVLYENAKLGCVCVCVCDGCPRGALGIWGGGRKSPLLTPLSPLLLSTHPSTPHSTPARPPAASWTAPALTSRGKRCKRPTPCATTLSAA